MLAAVFAGPGAPALEQRPRPHLAHASDVLLAVEACGVCGTDLHILADPPGHPARPGVVLGHEFVGSVVVAADEAGDLRPGDRVVVAPNLSCGLCPYCRRGLRNHCERFTTYGVFLDGGLAEHVAVDARACHPLARSVPEEIAALVEPLSTVVHGVEQASPFPGETAVVLGGGPVGLMFVALLRLAGASVVAVEPADTRRELAERLGADLAVDPRRDDAVRLVRERTDGLGADLVVDAVGSQLASALECVRKAGRIVLFGLNERARGELVQATITRDELTIVGSFVGQDVFPRAIELLEGGRLDLRPIVSDRVPLPELPAALDRLRGGTAVKVQVAFA